MSKIVLPALVIILLICSLASLPGRSSAAPLPSNPASASELVQLVNQLRAANGLQPYRVNSALMAAAQAHSEYQAETGNTSHTGKGGTRPRDRAVAHGYGGGAAVYVSENIATGTSLSAGEAVGWWQGDNLHLTTMLSSKYRDVGAGMAEANGVVYYTLDVGYIAGEEGQPPADQPPSNPPGGIPGSNPAPQGTPIALIVPIQAATPRADGSIVHEVQWGQFLYNIADAYGVELPYLLVLNSISANTVIYPGDKLTIRPADPTPTLQATPTAADTRPPPATGTPTGAKVSQSQALEIKTPALTPTPQQVQGAVTPVAIAGASVPGESSALESGQASAAGEPATDSLASNRQGLDPILVVIGGLIVLGTALMLVGSMINRRI